MNVSSPRAVLEAGMEDQKKGTTAQLAMWLVTN